ncbi:MAG: hypothetical protein GY799_29225 [Desulfobulbaceae bacterium]|nr:hypothetical protein [Desulfobulbaceae bacterium]
MKRYRTLLLKIVVSLACVLLASSQVWSGEQPGIWDAAGKEISEAAKAVGDASGESWQKTKEITAKTLHNVQDKGADVWGKTKDKSSDLVDKTVDVSSDVAEGTVEKSKGFWQKTKEISKEWLDKAKKKIHEITSPEPQHLSV